MQTVASGLQHLYKALGCDENAQQSEVYSNVGHKNGLLSDIQQLLAESKGRDKRTEVLQASVNHLVDVVDEDVRQNVKTRNANSKSCCLWPWLPFMWLRFKAINRVMDLINQQHQDQDHMLRALSTGRYCGQYAQYIYLTALPELTNEIRGERLRFVDAMKEATEINVQGRWLVCQ